MKDNQERLAQALEYDPQKAISYSGETLPQLAFESEGDDDPELMEIKEDDEGDTSESDEELVVKNPENPQKGMFNLAKGISTRNTNHC